MTDGITVQQLHTAIVEELRSKIKIFKVVAKYNALITNLETCACLIDLTSFDYDVRDDTLSNQLVLTVNFSAHCVANAMIPDAKLFVQQLAIDTAVVIKDNRFGLSVDSAHLEGIEHSEFIPGLERFNVLSVNWSQVCAFSDSVFDKQSVKVTDIYANFKPKIGLKFKPDYIKL